MANTLHVQATAADVAFLVRLAETVGQERFDPPTPTLAEACERLWHLGWVNLVLPSCGCRINGAGWLMIAALPAPAPDALPSHTSSDEGAA